MDFGLEGKTALVLGAGGGIGQAISTALAREGMRIVVADVNEAALNAVAKQVADTGVSVLPLLWDIADLGAIDAHIAAIEQRFGGVDVLVNNTGGPPPSPAAGLDAAVWQTYFNSMVVSLIKITDRVLPRMKERNWGRIITSASSGVIAPIPNLAVSNALRMALVGWSKSLAREVAPHGITANIIVPGRIATPRIHYLDEMKAKREGRDVAEVEAESLESIPMKRYGRPEEYANVVAFLASSTASYVTGSTVRVDGGLVANV